MDAPIAGTFLALDSLEGCMPIAFKNAAKQLNQYWRIHGAVFVSGVALQTKISLSSKFSRNRGSMSKTCFVNLGEVYDHHPCQKL